MIGRPVLLDTFLTFLSAFEHAGVPRPPPRTSSPPPRNAPPAPPVPPFKHSEPTKKEYAEWQARNEELKKKGWKYQCMNRYGGQASRNQRLLACERTPEGTFDDLTGCTSDCTDWIKKNDRSR
jgi:hypothetical protein